MQGVLRTTLGGECDSDVVHYFNGAVRHGIVRHSTRVCCGGHRSTLCIARQIVSNNCCQFAGVVPERDFMALIEDGSNECGPSMKEEAVGCGQLVRANAVFISWLHHPVGQYLSFDGGNHNS